MQQTGYFNARDNHHQSSKRPGSNANLFAYEESSNYNDRSSLGRRSRSSRRLERSRSKVTNSRADLASHRSDRKLNPVLLTSVLDRNQSRSGLKDNFQRKSSKLNFGYEPITGSNYESSYPTKVASKIRKQQSTFIQTSDQFHLNTEHDNEEVVRKAMFSPKNLQIFELKSPSG